MGIWLQRSPQGETEPAISKRLGLVLPGHERVDDLEQVLSPAIPAVDGVVVSSSCHIGRLSLPVMKLRKPLLERDLTAGKLSAIGDAYHYLFWLRPGETLLTEEPGVLRQLAQKPHATSLVPVHYRLTADLPLTLLGLEPRWIHAAKPIPAAPGFLGIPIESAAVSPPDPPAENESLVWVLLYRANRAVLTGEFERGYALFEHLFTHSAARLPSIAGVVVRNALAGALSSGSRAWKVRWLERAAAFRSYAEVQFLMALVPFCEGDAVGTIDRLTSWLEQDDQIMATQWISGHGERSYRALTCRGIAFHQVGATDKAVNDWSVALKINPHYIDPLQQIARLRLHADTLDRAGLRTYCMGKSQTAVLRVALAYAQSSEPELAAEVLASRKGLAIPKELKSVLRGLDAGRAHQTATRTAGVQWEGPFFTSSSLARVNRALAFRLMSWQYPIGIGPTEPASYDPRQTPEERVLFESLWRYAGTPAVTVRHSWPPLFRSARTGRVVTYLPWEFGAIPSEWLGPLGQVDQVWVYSEWVREGVIRSGVSPERVYVVPCGIDPAVFSPRAPAPFDADEAFRFLYVGGTIARKGYDLALQAFLAEFTPHEPVVLTIKDFGSDTFYRGCNGRDVVRKAAAATADAPRRVELIDRILTDEELAGLYRSASCLLAPYRAEGFCMPALESMGCGVPAILPAFGPALDYARHDTALLVSANPVEIGSYIDGMRLAGEAVLCEVPLAELRRTMRWAFEHRDELRAIGAKAAEDVHSRFTWEHAARRAESLLTLIR